MPLKGEMTMTATVDEILRQENEVDIVIAFSERITQKIEQSGFDSLTDAEKNFHYIYWLEAEVNNGGFDQYFFNSAGDHAQDAVGALQAIGANHTAQLLREAMAVFPEGLAPHDRGLRQEQLLEIGEEGEELLNGLDSKFYEYNDNLTVLLVAYVRQHKEQFGTSP